MVFEQPELSDLTVSFWSVLFPTVLALGAFSAIVVFAVGRTLLSDQQSGVDELVGSLGKATTAISSGAAGKVFIRGEYWNARTDESVSEGDSVEVLAVEGLKLVVRRVPGSV